MEPEQEPEQEPQTETQPRNKGGRPPQPPAPQTAAEVRILLDRELVKRYPSTPVLKGWQTSLESHERLERDAPVAEKLAVSEAVNAALQGEVVQLRSDLAAAQQAQSRLAVPAGEVERVKSECASLRSERDRAKSDFARGVKDTSAAVTARDTALSAQRTSESEAQQARQYVTDEFRKVIVALEAAARNMGPSNEGREQRVMFTYHMEVLKKMNAEAIARPVPVTPAPFTPVPRKAVALSAEKLAKCSEDLIQQAAIRNKQEQGPAIDLTGQEVFRERHVQVWEPPAPPRQITGAAYDLD